MSRQYSFEYFKYDSLDDMPDGDRSLVDSARGATLSSYAPYSDFRVGAAALLRSGRVISASNQESEVFPSGMCAERILLYNYQANYSDDPIVAMAITSTSSVNECYPCGACRQVMADTEQRQTTPIRVIMSGAESATVVGSSLLLMPFKFKL